jgi:glycosyltransferase involved in cell wall biosynthesis
MLANANIQYHKKSTFADAKFSILIPSWNNISYLKLCIESVRKNSTYTHQIIVHVNEGNDGTLEWLNLQEDIDYTYSKINIGVCYALNCARKLISTEYILYLNDDMYVCPGWDEILWKEIKKINHKKFFLSSTAIEPVAQSVCSIEKNYGTSVADFSENKLLSEYAQLLMNDWSGATWPPNIVHIDVWDAVGGYSTEFSPGMYSDPDFSMKLWQAGVRLFKGLSQSRVYHFGSKSVKRVNKNKGYYTFIAKWGITSSTFTKYYLHRGEKYNNVLQEPKLNVFLNLKNMIKRIGNSITRTDR